MRAMISESSTKPVAATLLHLSNYIVSHAVLASTDAVDMKFCDNKILKLNRASIEASNKSTTIRSCSKALLFLLSLSEVIT